MKNKSTKAIKLASILAAASLMYNLDTVETDEQWIKAKATDMSELTTELNNEAAYEIVCKSLQEDTELNDMFNCKEVLNKSKRRLTSGGR